MAERARTYRVPKASAPRLVFEISRLGTRLDPSRQTISVFRAPRGELELRGTADRRVLVLRVAGEERRVELGAGPLGSLLEDAGIRRELTYVNESEGYQCAGVIVSIDHIVPLGLFCVISADRPADIDALAARLGLGPADVEPLDYAELFRRIPSRAADPSPPRSVQPAPDPAPARAALDAPPLPTSARTVATAPAARTRPPPAVGRPVRLVLIAVAGMALALLFDFAIGVLAAAALLLLEWAFGDPRRAEADTR